MTAKKSDTFTVGDRVLGPNAKRLFIRILSRESVPDGGGLADGLKFFTDSIHRKQVVETALSNMDLFIEAIRQAPDNPYGKDEEVIAGILLERLDERCGGN